MTGVMTYSRVLVVALVVIACREPDRSPPPATASADVVFASDADYLKVAIAATVEVTEILEAAGKDCDKIAADVAAYASRKQATISAITSYERAHPEVKVMFDKQSTEQARAYRAASYPAVFGCEGRPDVIDAIRRAGGEIVGGGSGSGSGC
jgi:hypothetical protein